MGNIPNQANQSLEPVTLDSDSSIQLRNDSQTTVQSETPNLKEVEYEVVQSAELSKPEAEKKFHSRKEDEDQIALMSANESIKQELANDRKLVMAKTDHIYEVFICDKCSKNVKSSNIYLCETCDFDFGICESCFVTTLRSKERQMHEHNLICVPNTFYKPYNVIVSDSVKIADDNRTVVLLSTHPLTTQVEIKKEGEDYQVLFHNRLYFDAIISHRVNIYLILDLIPVILKSDEKFSLVIKREKSSH